MARMHRLPFIFYTLICSQIFALEVLASDRPLPQIGSVEMADEQQVTNEIGSVEITNNKFNSDSVSAQVSLFNMKFNAELSTNTDNINDGNIAPLFALASQYQFTESTQMDLRYNNVESDQIAPSPLNIKQSDTSRKEIVELAVQHKFNNELALIANANWKNWSNSVDNDSDNYEHTFGAGTALSYQVESWTIQTEVSIDTNPVSSESNTSLLGIDEQWRLGFGGIKKLNANMSLGMSYQYQSLGTTKVSREGMPIPAAYSGDNIHFITTTLSF